MADPEHTGEERAEAKGLCGFLGANKVWWMAPLIVVGVVAAAIVVLHWGFGISPFIYPVF